MLKIIGTDIVIRSFFTKTMHRGQGNAPVSVPQRWFRKLLGILKIWLLGEVFEPKLSTFSKNYFLLTQSTYFVIAPAIKFVFCICLGIHICYKFIQSFHTNVFRHAQNHWILRVSYISKMYLAINLIFCMCLCMHKYVST